MRIASTFAALIFLGVAAAGVVPDIAGRGVAVAGGKGGKGGPSASVSGDHSHPSGTPTLPSLHAIPSGSQAHSPASRRGEPNPTVVPSKHPLSLAATPTGSQLHPSGPPSGIPDYPIPSGGSQSHAPAFRRAEPTGGHSGIPSGTPVHPSGSVGRFSHRESVIPSIVPSHEPSSPVGSDLPPRPSAPVA